MKFKEYVLNKTVFINSVWPLHHKICDKEYVPNDVIGNFKQVN